MNQILVTEKVYMTPELKRKKLIYKIRFYSVIVFICLILIYYIVQEFQKHKSEQLSKSILNDITANITEDNTVKKVINDVLIVELESGYEEPNVIPAPAIGMENNTNEITSYITDSGLSYTIDAILEIPSLELSYPVISETSEELLKISVNKYWGRSPNAIGNYCIVGHNYGNGNMFGKLYKMEVGDTINLTGMNNKKTVTYEVYDIYITEPDDVACTSQLTGGKREVTLITCSNYGTQRRIIKCREKE